MTSCAAGPGCPATQLSSARAVRTGTIHCGSPDPSASASASSSRSHAPASPRRPRIVPRTRSGLIRLTGEMPCAPSIRAQTSAASSQRPTSSKAQARQPSRHRLNTPSSRSSQ